MDLPSRYRALPGDIRGSLVPYLAQHLISFAAPMDLSDNNRPYTIQIGENAFEGLTTPTQLEFFIDGGYALGDVSTGPALLISRRGLEYYRLEEYGLFLAATFPPYVVNVLTQKIRNYLEDIRRL